MKTLKILAALAFTLHSLPAFSAESTEIRVLGGTRHLSAWERKFDMHEFISQNGLPQITKLPMAGIEFLRHADNGFGFGYKALYNYIHIGDGTGGAMPNFSRLTSTSLLGNFRFYLVDTDFVRFDLLAGGGLSWAGFEYKKNDVENFVDSGVGLSGIVGSSFSIGYKGTYLFIEGGYMRTHVEGWKHRFDPKDGIHYLDLSGPYVLAGFAINRWISSK